MARINRRGAQALRDTLQRHIDKGRIPGAIAVVAVGGKVEVFETLGRQDPQAGSAMLADSIFRIYSMTKPIVSLAALMLADEGALELGDPISKYLPEFARQQVAVESGGGTRLVKAQREITVHDLLRHTSGLTYDFLGDTIVQQQYKAATLHNRQRAARDMCKVLATLPLQDHPGAYWAYGMSTDVLGAVVEVASGKALGQFLSERIFAPIGMKDTGFTVPREQWGRIAEPFANDPDTGEPVTLIEPREVPAMQAGGGGLLSTAGDYTRFLQLMHGNGSFEGTRLVSRKTIEWMTSDHLGGRPSRGELMLPGYGFGLGFSVRMQPGLAPQPGSVGQYFWSGIGGTSFFVDPAEDAFAMLLTQAPNQRFFFRNLFRHLAYAALE